MGAPGALEQSVESVLGNLMDSANAINGSGTEFTATGANNFVPSHTISVINQIYGAESLYDGYPTVNIRSEEPEVDSETDPSTNLTTLLIYKLDHGITANDLKVQTPMIVTPSGPIAWGNLTIVDTNIIQVNNYNGELPVTDVYLYINLVSHDPDGIKETIDSYDETEIIGDGNAISGFDPLSVLESNRYVNYLLED